MGRVDWRSPEGYEELRSLDAPGFALEFLSRNPEFQRDREALRQAASGGVLDPVSEDAFAKRWGLRFRRSRRKRSRKRRRMDPRGVAECHCDRPAAGWTC